jgi:hypothetical protein
MDTSACQIFEDWGMIIYDDINGSLKKIIQVCQLVYVGRKVKGYSLKIACTNEWIAGIHLQHVLEFVACRANKRLGSQLPT